MGGNQNDIKRFGEKSIADDKLYMTTMREITSIKNNDDDDPR